MTVLTVSCYTVQCRIQYTVQYTGHFTVKFGNYFFIISVCGVLAFRRVVTGQSVKSKLRLGHSLLTR